MEKMTGIGWLKLDFAGQSAPEEISGLGSYVID